MAISSRRALELALNYRRYGTPYPEKEKLLTEGIDLAKQLQREEDRQRLQEILRRLAA